MKRVAKFEKVSYEQFERDYLDTFGYSNEEPSQRFRQEIESMYYGLELPTRATSGSCGYDIHSPFSFKLKPKETIKIPTGLRCKIDHNYALFIHVRSSIGFKYHTVLSNITGIIDEDYYESDNEGHIFIKLVNHGDKTLNISRGDAICQGVFIEYGITEDDDVTIKRNGGIGSTGK